jgi:hypothetical protein
MSATRAKPILVTGAHRSGSTWVGRMIALSPGVGFIHEPFNLRHRPGICKARFEQWFPYLCEANGERYANDIRACLDFRYCLTDELKALKSLRDFARMARDYAAFTKHRLLRSRALQKDPIAIFSAAWLAGRFDMDVVVLIRHPAAFAGSLKSAGWTFPFEHFLQQDLLMERHLSSYRYDIEKQIDHPTDIIGQAILLWNVIHYVILKYQREHSNWHFLRHEDLSRNTVEEFRRLYVSLGLEFTDTIAAKIKKHSSAKKAAALKRDSTSNISTWKRRLTASEIERVRDGTQSVARAFYTGDSWA